MVDYAKLEKACRKKLKPEVLRDMRETVEAVLADDAPSDSFWAGLDFLLDRELQIDKALESK